MRWAVLVLGLMACGPTLTEIRTARTATYAAPPAQVFAAAVRAADHLYGIAVIDRDAFVLVTNPFSGDLDQNAHPGRFASWVNEPARAGFVVRVVALPNGHSLVVTRPFAQRGTDGCQRSCDVKSWVDVPPSSVHIGYDLQHEMDKLTLAIYHRAQQLATR